VVGARLAMTAGLTARLTPADWWYACCRGLVTSVIVFQPVLDFIAAQAGWVGCWQITHRRLVTQLPAAACRLGPNATSSQRYNYLITNQPAGMPTQARPCCSC
jgi:hypothetical protein